MTTLFRWLHIPAFACSLIASPLSAPAMQSAAAPFGAAQQAGIVENRLLNEASGLAASQRSDDVLWALNDSGNDPLVFALGKDGSDLGAVRVADAPNLDWEDLVSFTHNGKPYLLIADTGDNRRARETSYLHIIEEPDPSSLGSDQRLLVKRAWAIAFQFEDGPHDCEAVTVLPANNQILLVSKRDVPASIYTLPLVPDDPNQVQIARKLTTLDKIPQPSVANSRLGNRQRYSGQPTAADVSANGDSIAVLTYTAIYYWRIKPGEEIATLLKSEPVRIPLPYITQAEGLCFSPDGEELWVISETTKAPLYRLERTSSR